MPPEKIAYALARYSRSPDSIRDSVAWVRTHDSTKFLESFYFQYGHASIADLGHVVLCFEGISELAAAEGMEALLVLGASASILWAGGEERRWHPGMGELRAKRMTKSVLDGIPGLGEHRKKRLVAELGGVNKVKAASLEDLQSLTWLPDAVAQSIYSHLHP